MAKTNGIGELETLVPSLLANVERSRVCAHNLKPQKHEICTQYNPRIHIHSALVDYRILSAKVSQLWEELTVKGYAYSLTTMSKYKLNGLIN